MSMNEDGTLKFGDDPNHEPYNHQNSENVQKVLQPEKLFSEEAIEDLKAGDIFEICPSAV